MAYQPPPQNPGYNPQGYNPYQTGWNVPGSQPQPNFSSGSHYAEGGVPKSEIGFSNITIRAAFIRKVFFMVTIMVSY